MRNEALYLQDILRAIGSIQTFVEGMDLEAFQADDKTISAVVRKFEIIGEAAKHVSDDVRRQYPNVPWKNMAGMRDRLIHSILIGLIPRSLLRKIRNPLHNTPQLAAGKFILRSGATKNLALVAQNRDSSLPSVAQNDKTGQDSKSVR